MAAMSFGQWLLEMGRVIFITQPWLGALAVVCVLLIILVSSGRK